MKTYFMQDTDCGSLAIVTAEDLHIAIELYKKWTTYYPERVDYVSEDREIIIQGMEEPENHGF